MFHFKEKHYSDNQLSEIFIKGLATGWENCNAIKGGNGNWDFQTLKTQMKRVES